jgi:hypothetical protein
VKEDIKKMKDDIDEIKTKTALIQQDLVYVKERVTRVETVLYSIGALIVVAVLTVILNFFVRTPILK